MKTQRCYLIFVVLTACLAGCSSEPRGVLTSTDIEAMRDAANAYATAWLSNDAKSVMSVFVPEPVLSPSGLPYVEGQQAAREFWWPAGSPPLIIREFVQEDREVGGAGDYGFVRGTFRLAFDYGNISRVNTGKYISLMKRMDDGSWRISHQIWDDFPQPDP